MGDRGNIKVLAAGNAIFFYTHWRGSDLQEILKRALIKGESRWDDGAYLNRIIFQEMLGKDVGCTGFGIWSEVCDNEHPIITVDHDSRTVERAGTLKTFKEYIAE